MNVTVKVSDLYKLSKEMLNDGMDYVEVSIMEADSEFGLPVCLHFEASKATEPEIGVDYEELDDISSTL